MEEKTVEPFDIEDVPGILRNIALELYQQAEYIKQKNALDVNFNPSFESGILFAYSEALNTIRTLANNNNVDLDDLFDGGFKPYSVMNFRPKNWPLGKKLE